MFPDLLHSSRSRVAPIPGIYVSESDQSSKLNQLINFRNLCFRKINLKLNSDDLRYLTTSAGLKKMIRDQSFVRFISISGALLCVSRWHETTRGSIENNEIC